MESLSFIKNKLKRIYCSNCLDIMLSEKAITELNDENKKINQRNQHLLLTNQIQKFNSRSENIMYIEDTKNSYFIITVENEYNLRGLLSSINLYGYILEQYKEYPTQVMRLNTDIIYDSSYNCIQGIHIIDFVGESNKGYGSKIMNSLFDYIRPLNANYITGELSAVDEFDLNNKYLRDHFYQKFGFEITGKKICLELKS